MKKKVDSRVQILIENITKLHQRGFFVIVGDRGKDQVVNLHYLMTKHLNKNKPKVLWCYKKELGFSSYRQKRIKQVKKLQNRGNYDADVDDPFELFISSNEIRYCFYKETQKILGNTYSMLVLQDFESITPNILCRTIETVEGGGIVVMLIKTLTSLKQLYTMVMDVHQRFRTEANQDIQPRFNERFILSLAKCGNSIVMDDELNILPISSLINEIQKVSNEDSTNNKVKKELEDLKESMKSNQLMGPIVKLAKTLDQAKAVMQFVDAIVDKNFRYTVSLTAARGRGKSSAIGMSVAGAIACGFSNIFVTAPNPENLQTFFQFVFMGLEALGYKENMHYEIIQSTNQEFGNSVIRVNIFKSHKQFIQYILPTDSDKIGSADLVVIDEAAAIPLQYVKQLMGPYIVFLCSTVNGYEGTGRSLTLKLVNQLREQNRILQNQNSIQKSGSGARLLKEITLNDPIRYSKDDPIEKWLNEFLLLNATNAIPLTQGLPHPNDCELYMVNRDTLFSFHKGSEQFLFNLMSLFISSHYKNSPNDLQLMSDAPQHGIFVLIGNQKNKSEEQAAQIPDILCVVQVALEGEISRNFVTSLTDRGNKPSGDMIPWTMSEQYQDEEFPSLSGARVVRIATHPGSQKMGYGSKALELLSKFFEGQLIDLSNSEQVLESYNFTNNSNEIESKESQLTEEKIKPKKKQKPLLKKLTEIKPPFLHYLGVSFGITQQLFKFWRKNGYYPTYIRSSKNDTTGEHSCVMLKPLKRIAEDDNLQISEQGWIHNFTSDFKKRFLSLMAFDFRTFEVQLCIGILNPNLTTVTENHETFDLIEKKELLYQVSLYDLKRMEAYTRNLVDYHLIMDLLPTLSKLFYTHRLSENIKLSYSQAAILLGMGLQHKSVEQISEEMNIPVSQVLALFNKTLRKITTEIKSIYEKDIEQQMQQKAIQDVKLNPLKESKSDLQEEGKKFIQKLENQGQNWQKEQSKYKGKYNYNLDDLSDDKIQKLAGKNQDTVSLMRPKNEQIGEDQDEPPKKKKKKTH